MATPSKPASSAGISIIKLECARATASGVTVLFSESTRRRGSRVDKNSPPSAASAASSGSELPSLSNGRSGSAHQAAASTSNPMQEVIDVRGRDVRNARK